MAEQRRFRPLRGWWQPLHRSAFEIDHGHHRWTVDVDYLDLAEHVHLFCDSEHVETATSPATFELPGGATIAAAYSTYGVKYVELRTSDGRAPLRPVEGSGERWRADLARRHPRVSATVAAVSFLAVLAALVTQLPELANLLLGATEGLHGQGWRAPTFELSAPTNTAITVAAVAGAIERALGMRWSAWLDE